MHEAYSSLKDADDEQSKLANKLKSIKYKINRKRVIFKQHRIIFYCKGKSS